MPLSRPVSLHIGMPKTATTLLQTKVFMHHRDILSLRNHRVADSHPDNEPIHHLNTAPTEAFEADRVARFYRDRIAQCDRPCALLSWEDLAQTKGVVSYGEKTERLKRVFGAARILLTVREPQDMVQSLYSQWMRAALRAASPRRYIAFNDWVSSILEKRASSVVSNVHAYRVAEAHEHVFGRDAVSLFVYEELKTDKARFARRLSDALGIDADETLRLLGDFVVHPALTDRQVAFLRHFRAADAPEDGFQALLSAWLETVPQDLAARWAQDPELVQETQTDAGVGRLATEARSYLVGGHRAEVVLNEENAARIRETTAAGFQRLDAAFGLELARHGYAI